MCAWWLQCLSVLLGLLVCGCGEKPAEVVVQVQGEEMPVGLDAAGAAEWLIDRGRYAEARPLLEEVVEGRRAEGGQRLGEALMGLGMVVDALGEPAEGVEFLVEAWEIFQELEVPVALSGACADALGLGLHGAGAYEFAEGALLAAIELRGEASSGADEPWVSASRVHLGRLYLTMGRYEEAGELLEAALASAADDVSRVDRLRHFGVYHHTIGGYVRAIDLFGDALVLARGIWGEGGAQVAALLGDLGLAQLRAGDVVEAERNLLESRRRIEALVDAAPDLLAASAQNLATFYLFRGELERAQGFLSGADDPVALNNLGAALHLEGSLEEADLAFVRARDLAGGFLSDHHPLLVQILQNQACVLADRGEVDAALGLAREAGVVALALLDGLLGFGSERQRLDFRKTSDPLSLLCSFGGTADEIAEMVLRTKGVVLDSVLGARELGEVRRAEIPEGKVFVDYVVFQKYLGLGKWEQWYGAVVLGDGGTRWVDLGKADELIGLLSDLRAHMEAVGARVKSDAVFSLEAVLGGLYEFCIAPLGEVGDALVVSPAGELMVLPFAALRHEGKFFCEIVSEVKLVGSGRDDGEDDFKFNGRWTFCGVSDYSGPSREWPGAGVGFGEDLWDKVDGLGNLPGVKRERKMLGDVKEFWDLPGGEAELRSVLSKQPVEVLHFSCHGFFLGDGEKPMSRSGLVLGGARESLARMAEGEPVAGEDDGLLLAGELAELNLWATQLVTLAACDTALGERVAGEGVLGLQRGFQLAGAQNLLMTLWAVGDEESPEFLEAFYRRYAAGESASVAVWRTQAERLREGTLREAVWAAGGFTVLAR